MDKFKYKAKVVRVIDGDTIEVMIDFGFHFSKTMHIRLDGIDTPELRGGTLETKAAARKAKQFVIDEVDGKDITLLSIKESDKYGRCVGRILYDNDKDLTELLLEKKLGKVYNLSLDVNPPQPQRPLSPCKYYTLR